MKKLANVILGALHFMLAMTACSTTMHSHY